MAPDFARISRKLSFMITFSSVFTQKYQPDFENIFSLPKSMKLGEQIWIQKYRMDTSVCIIGPSNHLGLRNNCQK